MDALTSPTHRDALRVAALAGDEGVTAVGVSLELKATRAHVLDVLSDLEEQGFVKGTPARGRRRPGVATVFRVQLPKIEAALQELGAWVLGREAPVTLEVDNVTRIEEGNPS